MSLTIINPQTRAKKIPRDNRKPNPREEEIPGHNKKKVVRVSMVAFFFFWAGRGGEGFNIFIFIFIFILFFKKRVGRPYLVRAGAGAGASVVGGEAFGTVFQMLAKYHY